MTFVGPVQSGKSVVGEAALCYWISTQNGGDIQYNWQNDLSADGRWDKRIERILKACRPVMARASPDRFKWKRGQVIFPHCNLTVQGVFSDRNVASDSVRFQINEEIHDADSGWAPGKLQQAWNRTTAYWNSVIFNISNAGYKGDQLEQSFMAGTQQYWEVKCPGCGQYHRMRTRWDEKKPELGGLRYDYEKEAKEIKNIRFQMPCGAVVGDVVGERRRLSLSGRYSQPTKLNGQECSYTLEAVAVDYIPWRQLIEEKHRGLRSLKLGDPKPWFDYLRERECQFVNSGDRPVLERIKLSDRKKDREGLADKDARFGALDRQGGDAGEGELPHWWALIQDIKIEADGKIHILTVWEGKCLTDEDAADVMHRHQVQPSAVVADSGYDTTHVYQFCLKHGFNAIKGSAEAFFAHEDHSRKIFSPERPLCAMLNMAPTRDNELDEPQFWFYSKAGIRERLAWLRSSDLVNYEVPADISEDFQAHFEAESLETRKHPRTGEELYEWIQHGRRNDLFVCACYIAMLMEMAEFIGAPAEEVKSNA